MSAPKQYFIGRFFQLFRILICIKGHCYVKLQIKLTFPAEHIFLQFSVSCYLPEMIVPHCQKDQQPDSGRLQHSLNLVPADRFHRYPEMFKLKAIMLVFPYNNENSLVRLSEHIIQVHCSVIKICRLFYYSPRTVKEESKIQAPICAHITLNDHQQCTTLLYLAAMFSLPISKKRLTALLSACAASTSNIICINQ